MKIDRATLSDLERAAWGAAFEHALALRCDLASNRHAGFDRMSFGRAVLIRFDDPDVCDAKTSAAWADQVVAAMRLVEDT